MPSIPIQYKDLNMSMDESIVSKAEAGDINAGNTIHEAYLNLKKTSPPIEESRFKDTSKVRSMMDKQIAGPAPDNPLSKIGEGAEAIAGGRYKQAVAPMLEGVGRTASDVGMTLGAPETGLKMLPSMLLGALGYYGGGKIGQEGVKAFGGDEESQRIGKDVGEGIGSLAGIAGGIKSIPALFKSAVTHDAEFVGPKVTRPTYDKPTEEPIDAEFTDVKRKGKMTFGDDSIKRIEGPEVGPYKQPENESKGSLTEEKKDTSTKRLLPGKKVPEDKGVIEQKGDVQKALPPAGKFTRDSKGRMVKKGVDLGDKRGSFSLKNKDSSPTKITPSTGPKTPNEEVIPESKAQEDANNNGISLEDHKTNNPHLIIKNRTEMMRSVHARAGAKGVNLKNLGLSNMGDKELHEIWKNMDELPDK